MKSTRGGWLGVAAVLVTAAIVAAIVGNGLIFGGAATIAGCTSTSAWKGKVTGPRLMSKRLSTERNVVLLVNAYRKAHGLSKLKLDVGLRYAARYHSTDQAQRHYFEHERVGETFPQRMGRYVACGNVGENLSFGSGGYGTATGIVSLWRSSPSHRAILLTPKWRSIGVGIVNGNLFGNYGTIATADFAQATPVRVPPLPHQKPPIVPQPAPPSPSPPPPAPGPPASAPVVGGVVGVPYVCRGPVNDLIVRGTGSSPIALVVLGAGCTGTISFDVHVTEGGGDGVKVQGGAHDLAIGPSTITCDKIANANFHQDGVQIQGGANVTFTGLSIVCPFVTGQGAAGFYIDGKDFAGISNVVCDGCNLSHLHYGAMFTGPAPGSGVRNSIIHQGALTKGYYAFPGGTAGSVNENNVYVAACDGAATPC